MSATARVTILMTPKEKKQLFAQAKLAGFDSVGAYLRRKALGPEEDPTLDALVEAVRESTQRANAALDQVLASIQRHEQEAPNREAAARVRAEVELRSWPPGRLSSFREQFGLAEGGRP